MAGDENMSGPRGSDRKRKAVDYANNLELVEKSLKAAGQHKDMKMSGFSHDNDKDDVDESGESDEEAGDGDEEAEEEDSDDQPLQSRHKPGKVVKKSDAHRA